MKDWQVIVAALIGAAKANGMVEKYGEAECRQTVRNALEHVTQQLKERPPGSSKQAFEDVMAQPIADAVAPGKFKRRVFKD
jgi:hypothetical protein